jgi:hypothetical protein
MVFGYGNYQRLGKNFGYLELNKKFLKVSDFRFAV